MDQTDRKTALVLGGTSPHIDLIRNLRARGYRTILVDYLENPPAREHADLHLRESTLDPEAVLRIARETGAALVIATCVDQANVIACQVSETLGLPHPYSYETAATIANKGLMKARLIAHGMPTARFVHVRNADAPDIGELRFPLVVKPADSNGSAGVRRADTPEQLTEYLRLAIGQRHLNQSFGACIGRQQPLGCIGVDFRQIGEVLRAGLGDGFDVDGHGDLATAEQKCRQGYAEPPPAHETAAVGTCAQCRRWRSWRKLSTARR